jgi:hypothetical protein
MTQQLTRTEPNFIGNKFMKKVILFLVVCSFVLVGRVLAFDGKSIEYKIEASSTLKGKISYDVTNLLDIDPSKAWCTDINSKKKICLKIIPSHSIRNSFKIIVLPGYAKSNELFFANSRPKSFLLLGIDDKGNEVLSKKFVLQDMAQAQEFIVSRDEFSHEVAELRFSIVDAYDGKKYEDLCISEIRLNTVIGLDLKYEDKSKIIDEEILIIKEAISNIKSGRFVAVVNLFRLADSPYYQTAEGGEWLAELYLDYFVENPYRYLFLLSRQSEKIKIQVEKALLTPVSDKYEEKVLAMALKNAISSGILGDDYSELVNKYINLNP